MNTETKDVVNSISETLIDSRNGYHECANNVDEPLLKQKFNELAEKRQNMLNQLQRAANEQGIFINTEGSMTAAAHRIFVDIKSFFTGNDKGAILKEIERGEGYLIEAYKKAIDSRVFTGPITNLLTEQLNEIRDDYSYVKSFYS